MKKWKSYCTEKELPQYENHIFLSVCEIRPGIILAGGYMSGIFRIDKKAGTTTFHQQGKSQARETPDKYIRGLIKDKNEVIWSGGFYSLKNFDTRTQEKQEYSSSYPITYLLERNENSFWVGTIQGLYVFDKPKQQLYPYMEKEDFGCINAIYNTPDLKKRMSAPTVTGCLSLIIKQMKSHTAWPITAACKPIISIVLFLTRTVICF